jgi:hypothetical protein
VERVYKKPSEYIESHQLLLYIYSTLTATLGKLEEKKPNLVNQSLGNKRPQAKAGEQSLLKSSARRRTLLTTSATTEIPNNKSKSLRKKKARQ